MLSYGRRMPPVRQCPQCRDMYDARYSHICPKTTEEIRIRAQMTVLMSEINEWRESNIGRFESYYAERARLKSDE